MKPHTRRAPKTPLRTFEIPCRVTRSARVTVQAANAEDAMQKFAAGDWFGEEGVELLDWAPSSLPKDVT